MRRSLNPQWISIKLVPQSLYYREFDNKPLANYTIKLYYAAAPMLAVSLVSIENSVMIFSC